MTALSNKKEEDNAPDVHFRKSTSVMQDFGSFWKSRLNQDIWKKKFKGEELFGTIAIAISTISQLHSLDAAWHRQVPVNNEAELKQGIITDLKNEKDWSRIVPLSVLTALNFWSFISDRKGVPPEGDTFFRRVANAVRHPNESLAYFNLVSSTPTGAYAMYGNLKNGLKSYDAEKIRLLQAFPGPAAFVFSYFGLFKEDYNKTKSGGNQDSGKPATVQSSSPSKNPLRRVRDMWNYQPQTVICEVLCLVSFMLGLYEGIRKRSVANDVLALKKPQLPVSEFANLKTALHRESHDLITADLLGLALRVSTAYYTFGKLLEGKARGNEEKQVQQKQQSFAERVGKDKRPSLVSSR